MLVKYMDTYEVSMCQKMFSYITNSHFISTGAYYGKRCSVLIKGETLISGVGFDYVTG